MPLRIGVDLDGVLADMEKALLQQAETLFGPKLFEQPAGSTGTSMLDLVPEDASDDAPLQHEVHLTARDRRKLWRHVAGIENFWETLDETEAGIVARLWSLALERRWEIIFLTRRPATAGATSQMQSQRWLESKGFRWPSVFVVTGSRELIASALALDLVVDDTPENCVDVAADSRARTIAIFRNRDVPPPEVLGRMGIHVVHTMEDCLALLVDIDSSLAPPASSSGGTLSRVMQTLGLKTDTPG